MKRNLITIYSVIISIVFIFAIAFLGLNIVSEYRHSSERTNETFELLKKAIRNDGEDFNKNRILGNLSSFSSIYIEKNGKVLISYPNENAENADNSKMISVFSGTVENFDDIYDIKAGLYLIRPEIIFYYARFSFIIIMVATILTAILIIYFSASSPKNIPAEESEENDYTDKETELAEAVEKTIAAKNQEQIKSDEHEDNVQEPSLNEEGFISPDERKTGALNQNISDYGSNKPKETDTEAVLESAEFPEPEVPDNEPLYSPVTGAQWETGLEKKLDDELVKAASSEQDLSLFEVSVPELDFKDPKAREIYSYILDQIQNQEFIFEYKDHGFAFIKTDTNIDEAEDFAEIIHQNIYDLVSERGLNCYIGISSRSIRMLSASRLIHEADQALNHAVDEKQPIIGFHVDIEKYKEFLKNSQN